MSNTKPFKPVYCLSNPHFQTLWPSLFRRPIKLSLRRERIELPDGDFIDLDWGSNPKGSIAIIFHGQVVIAINTPTLILHAEDDPFLEKSAIPDASNIPEPVSLELSQHGGHVGKQGYWLE